MENGKEMCAVYRKATVNHLSKQTKDLLPGTKISISGCEVMIQGPREKLDFWLSSNQINKQDDNGLRVIEGRL